MAFSLGQLAYEAYRVAAQQEAPGPLSRWGELGRDAQRCWEEAAQAVAEYTEDGKPDG